MRRWISLLLSWSGMRHWAEWVLNFWVSIPWKNVCKLGFMPVLPTSMMHWSVYLVSCQMHGIGLLCLHCGRDNPTIVCILPLFCQMLLFVLVCSTAIELRAFNTVMLAACAKYKILPKNCWTCLIPFTSSFGDVSGGRGDWASVPNFYGSGE